MKILQINTVYGIASTGRSMAELHEFLQNKGHQGKFSIEVQKFEGFQAL